MAGAVLLVGLISELSLYAVNRFAVRKAESLLQEGRLMRVGITTQGDVERVVQDYGGDMGRHFGASQPCESEAPRWRASSVEVKSKVLNWIGLRDFVRGTHFRQFGPAVWTVTASFSVDDNDRLACIEYRVGAMLIRSDALQLRATETLPYPNSEPSYGTAYRDIHHVQSFGIGASNNAAPEQREHIFDLDLRCLNWIGGCRTPKDVMPGAWSDYLKQAH